VTAEVELLESDPQVEALQPEPLSDQVTPSPEPWEMLADRVTESPGSTFVLAGGTMETVAELPELLDPPQPVRQLRSNTAEAANENTRRRERRFIDSSRRTTVRAVDR
jgi:hypothetical protein